MDCMKLRRSCIAPALACLLGALLCGAAPALAQPRTMYRGHDIDNARRNVEQHSWARAIVSNWEGAVALSMQQDREFFEELIPALTPGTIYGQNCPACLEKGTAVMGEYGYLGWSISAPDQLTCRRCATVYPNERYPETGVLECPRMGQTFTYYETPAERANPQDRVSHALIGLSQRPQMTSFSGLIRHYRAQWAWGQAFTLARLHALTGEIAQAERVAWILDRFARVYPDYLYRSYDGSHADWPPAEVAANMGDPATPRGGRFPPDAIRHAYDLHRHDGYSTLHNGFWGAGRLNTHGKGSDSGVLLDLTIAYDLVRDATYPDGRRLLDEETDRRILEGLIVAGCEDMEHWDDLSNKGVTTRSLSAAVGTLLQDPDRVRRALEGLERVMQERYHFDGFYSESPAYAAHNYSNMRELPDLLHGYSDPPNYQPPEGARIDDYDPFAVGRVHLSLQAMVRMLAPGNRMPVIGNTVRGTGMPVLYAEILAARIGGHYAGLLETLQGALLSERGTEYALWYRPADLQAPEGEVDLPLRSEWFPGWHVGVLRGGCEANQTALYLNGNEHRWTVRTGHRHRDILGLAYWAHGRELISDRGYFSGSRQVTPDGRSGQSWTGGTLSHNLVVVDEESQATRECGSNLELFGVSPGIEVVQASGFNAYPQCEEYRRTTALVQGPGGEEYVVDFFRVRGGEVHQYSFHCNGELVSMEPAAQAPEPVDLAPAWSNWLSNARAVIPDTPHRFTWRHDDLNLDLLVLNTTESVDRIVIADAPGWRRAAPAEFRLPPIQQVLVEHRSQAPAQAAETMYATVMLPYLAQESPVLSARLVENDSHTGAMAVEVRFAHRTDLIISTRDQQPRQYGPVTVAGEFAFASLNEEGRALQGYLLNGTLLEAGGMRVSLPAPHETLRVRAVSGRTYHLQAPLPAGQVAPGAYLLACGPEPMGGEGAPRPRTGFEVEAAAGDAITVRDYPVPECDEITLLHSAWVEQDP